MAQPFGATNKPGTCIWCGRKLRGMTRARTWTSILAGGEEKQTYYPPEDPNPWPGLFDTRGCAESFGVTLAKAGRRLRPEPRAEVL